MKKLPLCLTAVICFSLLSIACTDEDENARQCSNLYNASWYSEALPLCQKTCDLNGGEGCTYLGILYAEGKGVKQDYQKAITYFEKACNKNSEAGCYNLGDVYVSAMKDYQKARSYYEKACNLHVRDGCYNLGVIYYNGQGVRQNFQMAKEYLGQACDMGQQDGCDAYKMLNEKGY